MIPLIVALLLLVFAVPTESVIADAHTLVSEYEPPVEGGTSTSRGSGART
jgi:hypothetical protein